ncbi:MAG: TonB family protein [Gemmatimonadota bacterium]|nr:TonB family protein [Gemmatimonadota bacterium]
MANIERKRGSAALWLGLAVSVALHGGLAWLLQRTRVGFPPPRLPAASPEVVIFRNPLPNAPPEVRIPPPARPIARPAPPTGPLTAPEALDPPESIPHDVPPRLVNGPDILAALQEGYPDDLPPEAAESRVLLWLFVDTGGRVTKLRLQRSSGFEALDRLATRLAPNMAYTPALHQGRRVGVWVAQRIRFQPPDGSGGGPRPAR